MLKPMITLQIGWIFALALCFFWVNRAQKAEQTQLFQEPPSIARNHRIILNALLCIILGGSAFLFFKNQPRLPHYSYQGKTELQITQAEFRQLWPLSVSEGTLLCEGQDAILFRSGKTTYGVNPAAQAKGYTPLQEITKPSEMFPLKKKDLNPIRQTGLKLCGALAASTKTPVVGKDSP